MTWLIATLVLLGQTTSTPAILLPLQVGSKGANSESDAIDLRFEAARKTLADRRRPVDQRASIALDEAAAFDRVALSSRSPEERRSRTSQAIALLDEFNASQPGHAHMLPIALQAGVYTWADGRREADAWRLAPRGSESRDRAVRRFDESIQRLAKIEPELSGADPLVAQNAGYRLAQSLVDRSRLDPPDSPETTRRLERALATITPPPLEPAVAGFARLLRAEIRGRLGRYDLAEDEIAAAAKLPDPPAPTALLEAEVAAWIGQGRFSDAIRAIDNDRPRIPTPIRQAQAIRVRLAERRARSAGSERDRVDVDALARAKALRGLGNDAARLALIDVAAALPRPPNHSDPEAWETLADGAIAIGDDDRAIGLLSDGADEVRTGDSGGTEMAAKLRLRAAAIAFRAGDYDRADRLLGLIWDSPRSGASRSKAGMLRALARGRVLEGRRTMSARARYVESLEAQLEDYPDDPASSEARWLLGEVERDEGRTAGAIALWEAIPRDHPRWLASRTAIAIENQGVLDETQLADSGPPSREAYRSASSFLRKSIQAAADGPEDASELDLAAIRLDLTPGVGRPEMARSLASRLARGAGSEASRSRARSYLAVASALAGRADEAEAESRRLPADDAIRAARLVDAAGFEAEAQSVRIRAARLIKALLDGLEEGGPQAEPSIRSEAKLRLARAQILGGELEAAKRTIQAIDLGDPAFLGSAILRDVADTFSRLGADRLAVDAERLRARSLRTGSITWLDSRYHLARSLEQSGHRDEAKTLLDATAILHPELGGGQLAEKFRNLRQRVE